MEGARVMRALHAVRGRQGRCSGTPEDACVWIGRTTRPLES